MNYIYKNNIYVVKSVFLLFLMIITSFCFDIPTSTARYEETETDYLKYHSSLTLVQKEEGNINLESLLIINCCFQLDVGVIIQILLFLLWIKMKWRLHLPVI